MGREWPAEFDGGGNIGLEILDRGDLLRDAVEVEDHGAAAWLDLEGLEVLGECISAVGAEGRWWADVLRDSAPQ